ncbi:T9SS type A sorting domain-containing protein [Kaistella pullorum]|uniref:T9SS type A sorting domain-containing protein n=1 Tax=Kaistella pullorum TaxID=2763074 RepID=A0ABR8WQ04_9FLAO|nr:T9SS type A sorting domain-containing protein [Kaistella pullorum]MBD8018771.1 T9SS type A sorting domain-containing protein [Kaistella pullorum]
MKKLLLVVFSAVFCFGNAQFTEITSTSSGLIPPIRIIDKEGEVWQNRLFYQGRGSTANPLPLMVTDGTAAGTKVVKNLSATVTQGYDATSYSGIRDFKAAESWMYFTFENKATGLYELWRTDGTAANTIKIDEGKSFNIRHMDAGYGLGNPQNPYSQEINGMFHYLKVPAGKPNQELWKTDGNPGGSVSIQQMTLNKGLHHVFNGSLYITSGLRMYRYDGQSVSIFVDYQNPSGVTISQAFDIYGSTANKMFFKAIINQVVGLYSLDTAGTIKFEYDLSVDSLTDFLRVTGEKNAGGFYVKTTNSRNGQTKDYILYCTDQGVIEKEIPAGQSVVYFEANDNTAYLIYTKSGESKFYMQRLTPKLQTLTEAVYPYITGTMSIYTTALYQDSFWFNFGVTDANYITDREIWRTDGIQETTKMVKNIDPVTYNNGDPRNFFILNGKLYFFATVNYVSRLFEYKGDYTFSNSLGDNLWTNPENWNSKVVPNSVDETIIPTGLTPKINGNAYARNLNISSPLNIESGNLNIFGISNLNNRINVNNSNLNLKGNSSVITGGNTTNYIVTNGTGTVNIENIDAGRGTVNLPVGTANHYNPVTLANSGTSDTFSVKVSEGIANAPGGAVNATWDISEGTPGGSNATISLGWNASQQNGTFNPNNATVGHFVNGVWTAENSGAVSGSNPYTITGSGITSFSPFAVMNLGALGTADPVKKNISVYPNPFREVLTITAEDKATVQFYDMTGKMVGSHALVKGTNMLSPAAVKPGVYLYQVKNNSGNVMASGKVIKK